jgi:hypothetical protein
MMPIETGKKPQEQKWVGARQSKGTSSTQTFNKIRVELKIMHICDYIFVDTVSLKTVRKEVLAF